jgi:hypothetical protein
VASLLKVWSQQAVVAVGALLLACGSAGYTVDSATSACRQNPGYCALVSGEETVVPTATRGGVEIASVAATLRVLTSKTQTDLEQALVECAEWAHGQVNLQYFGGKSPSRAQCQEEVEKDPCDKNKRLTRAMQLGREKHRLALQCTAQKLGGLIPGRFSLEQRYRYDEQTGQLQLISREKARALCQQGCSGELEGTIVPDVVIHSGNPLQIMAVYDFKFPCPISNPPRWAQDEDDRCHQGNAYFKALGVGPDIVAPIWKFIRWVTP